MADDKSRDGDVSGGRGGSDQRGADGGSAGSVMSQLHARIKLVKARAALGALTTSSLAHAQTSVGRSTLSHYHVPANDKTVHWGYFSKSARAGARGRSPATS